jgi:DNA-binding GntR family transcriptional regulator
MSVDPNRQLTTGPSLADQAFGVLRDLITSGELPPGERLTERGLAARLGVSPTPIREAISRLVHERLLVRVNGRMLQVASLSPRRLWEMSLIQAALRGVAARLTAESASDAELNQIEAAYRDSMRPRRRSRPANPGSAGSELRHEFHQLIVRASHNPSLIDMIATAEAFGRTLPTRAQASAGASESIQRAEEEHAAIVAALNARDGEQAETLVREHTLWINEAYLEFAEQHGLVVSAAADQP